MKNIKEIPKEAHIKEARIFYTRYTRWTNASEM